MANEHTMRRSARVLLFDNRERIVLIRRERNGRAPYLTVPGGGLEASETPEMAARRELLEELKARFVLGPPVLVDWLRTPTTISTQYFYVGRLLSMAPETATGAELQNPANGRYIPQHLQLSDPELQTLQPPSILDLLTGFGEELRNQALQL